MFWEYVCVYEKESVCGWGIRERERERERERDCIESEKGKDD